MFDGLCAFPLTPIVDERIDFKALASLVSRAAEAGVDSLGVLGFHRELRVLVPG